MQYLNTTIYQIDFLVFADPLNSTFIQRFYKNLIGKLILIFLFPEKEEFHTEIK